MAAETFPSEASINRTLITDLYPHIKPEVPGCEESLILLKIRSKLLHFFVETKAWVYEMDPFKVKEGETDYDLEWPQDVSNIETIKTLTLNEVEQSPGIDYTISCCRTMVSLVVEPSADTAATEEGVKVTLILKPRSNIQQINTCMYEEWYQTWAWGVMSDLMKMPNKKWTDKAASVEYNKYYVDGTSEARNENIRERLNVPLMARSPFQFAQGSQRNSYYYGSQFRRVL